MHQSTVAFVLLSVLVALQPVIAQNSVSGHNPKHQTKPAPSSSNVITATQKQREVLSESGAFRVELLPRDNTIPLLELHDWTARIFDLASDQYIHPEHLSLSGGMKAHGHGLPTSPKLVGRQGDHHQLTGVRFNMAGNWHLQIKFVYRSKIDTALFELEFATDNQTQQINNATLDTPGNAHAGHGTTPASTKIIDWSPSEIQLLKSLSLISGTVQPNNSGNARSADVAAANFGHKLFFDKRLSKTGQHACSSCHNPETYFNDQKITGEGLQQLTRNTPTIVGAGLHRWQYWDGRRDSLWSQALVPLEAPAEMGSSRVAVARNIALYYRHEYQAIFGLLPRLPDAATVPDNANPTAGDDARKLWNAIDADTRHNINTVFTNVGKAIAAYEMKLMPAPARFDQFVEQLDKPGQHNQAHSTKAEHSEHKTRHVASQDSHTTLMSELELQGLKLFISNKTQCLNCHATPMFTNYGFHNIGTGINTDGELDFGRMMGSQAVLFNEFNCRSRYSDGNTSGTDQKSQNQCAELEHINLNASPTVMQGAFRVPGLRGLEKTAPYMHDGRYTSLAQVIKHYSEPPAYLLGQFHEMPRISPLRAAEIDALEAFLLTLGSKIDTEPHWLHPPTR